MEVCGGHTAAIHRYGIRTLLPEAIELVSGPGCPVCVTTSEFVDQALALAYERDTAVVTFGDLMRVPGSKGTLSQARALGCDVRIVYSPADALDMAASNSRQTVVFLGIGFETTACAIAETVARAIQTETRNFKILGAMKTMPAALKTLLSFPDVQVDGLILPGHVTTITGIEPFEFISRDLGIGCCISGFEPVDLLKSVLELTHQAIDSTPQSANHYRRAVIGGGNRIAQKLINQVFEPCDATWRGLGTIANSGLRLRDDFRDWDACDLCVEQSPASEKTACCCGQILRGTMQPPMCPLFGSPCTPESPYGACMVSSEGACAAAYHYQTSDELES